MNPFILTLKTYKLDVEIHKHSAFQIVFTTDNPFSSIIDNIENQNIFGFVIKPHVSHLCTAKNSILNIINIEPYSPIGFFIQSKFLDNAKTIIFRNSKEMTLCLESTENLEEDILHNIMAALIARHDYNKTDERITKIITYIKENYYSQDITPQLFADFIFLSPSRLASLFKQQIGSSLSKYLLWTRLRQAIHLSLSKKEMTWTEIAYYTGFYDLPQLNKYMYEMFGVPPKVLRQNSDLIQVY